MRQALLILAMCIGVNVLGQEDPDMDNFKHHRLSWRMGFAHASSGADQTDKYFTIPSWGINYDYWFNTHFGAGLRSNMDVTEYQIELSNGEILKRKYPVSITAIVTVETLSNLLLHFGPGYEVDTSENLFLMELGARYLIPLREDFALVPSVNYYNKEGKFDTWSLGLEAMFRF